MKKQITVMWVTSLLFAFIIIPFVSENVRAAGWITVNSPSSGDIWYLGETHEINWSSENASNYVKIELYNSGSSILTIDSNAPNNGYYSWTVPTNLTKGSEYMTKITSTIDSNVSDLSDYFSIDERYINVTSPTSEDTWNQGSTYTIYWESENIGSYVKIDLYESNSHVLTIDSNAPNNGYYSWTVPTNLTTSSNYRIKITCTTYSGVHDYSDYFSFGRTITVSSPTSQDTWNQGLAYIISWESENIGSYVKIDLYESNSHVLTIESNSYNDGSHSWTIPTNLTTSSNYRIKITCTTYSGVHDYSDYFSFGRTITVSSPSYGNKWYKDNAHQISWESENIGSYVKIDLYESNSHVLTIESNSYNDGSHSWTIPTDLTTSSNYKIKITCTTYSGVYDSSDYFTIDERFITVTSPTSGDKWYQGRNYTISWESENIGNYVKIDLYDGGSYILTIESNSYNDGSQLWTIPMDLSYSSSLRIRIVSIAYDNVYGYSDYFSLRRKLIVTYPNFGDTWYRGDQYDLSWESENVGDYVRIELYKSNSLVLTIESITSNDGVFSWTVPTDLSISPNYMIKITSTHYKKIYDDSSRFTIDERYIHVTSPPNGETWYFGFFSEQQIITWESKNVGSHVKIDLYDGESYVFTIDSNADNEGTYLWKLPTNLSAGSNYKIKISSISNDNVCESSGCLTIEPTFIQNWYWGVIILFFILIILIVILYVQQTDKAKKKKLLDKEKKEIVNLIQKSTKIKKTNLKYKSKRRVKKSTKNKKKNSKEKDKGHLTWDEWNKEYINKK